MHCSTRTLRRKYGVLDTSNGAPSPEVNCQILSSPLAAVAATAASLDPRPSTLDPRHCNRLLPYTVVASQGRIRTLRAGHQRRPCPARGCSKTITAPPSVAVVPALGYAFLATATDNRSGPPCCSRTVARQLEPAGALIIGLEREKGQRCPLRRPQERDTVIGSERSERTRPSSTQDICCWPSRCTTCRTRTRNEVRARAPERTKPRRRCCRRCRR